MLTDVLTGWTAETLGGLTVLAAVALAGWFRRCLAVSSSVSSPAPAVTSTVRTYTLLGVRAADGQPVHLPSSRAAGSRVIWNGPAREEFVLTDAVLPDGTYAAERVGLYQP
ncbi:hypothetical protein [Streptomyces sp. NPDC001389]|uniref:hypothetical protein n=1 Tax=Streptomyces sp. NPDC001389 TaxID=3364569 RepID=UPI0036A0A19C